MYHYMLTSICCFATNNILPFIVPPTPLQATLVSGVMPGEIVQVMDNQFTLMFNRPSNINGMLEYVCIVKTSRFS